MKNSTAIGPISPMGQLDSSHIWLQIGVSRFPIVSPKKHKELKILSKGRPWWLDERFIPGQTVSDGK